MDLKFVLLILEVIKVVLLIMASGVGLYGINAWRRETRWKTKYNLAEEVLTLVYEVQHTIDVIRSPHRWCARVARSSRIFTKPALNAHLQSQSKSIIFTIWKSSEN